MSFSERYGYKPVRSVLQREAMDDPLRISLWNVLELYFWASLRDAYTNPGNRSLADAIWLHHFKWTLDTVPSHWLNTIGAIKNYYFDSDWNEVYDFVEFLSIRAHDPDGYRKSCNAILEREGAAYRFVGTQIVEITSETEIESIESAIQASKNLGGAETHLRAALDLLSDRANPDYRNSIKESISAVEAVANAASGTTSATLGAALKTLKGPSLHPALEGAFSKLYGYTSNAQGIRHALMDEPDLSFEDAKFMLVACSAFVNYLAAKLSKTGTTV